jgi:YkoY family integral membrane protein
MLAAIDLFGQVFDWHDLVLVGLLIVLEGVLSIDNALVLGLLAKRLPKHQQPRALTYGLVGAFAFRLLAIGTAGLLLKWRVVKLIGGGYLVYIAIKHLFFSSQEEDHEKLVVSPEGEPQLVDERTGQPLSPKAEELEIAERVPVDTLEIHRQPGTAKFWPTVLVIELTDIAFAVDSILAAIALVGAPPPNHPAGALHPKLWVVLVGGFLGVILMRFAAVIFIKLLERFPRFEEAAYLLVIVIGGKLLADYFFNTPPEPLPPNWHAPFDFHSPSNPAFWIFWVLMVLSFCVGFLPKRQKSEAKTPA